MSVHKDKSIKSKPYYVKHHHKTYRGFKTKNEAQAFEYKLVNDELDNNSEFITFSSLAKEYLNHQKAYTSYGTYQKCKNIIENIILPNVPNKILENYRQIDCQRFADYVLTLDYSTTYKNVIIQKFKRLFYYACSYYGLIKNPAICIQKIDKSSKEKINDYDKRLNVWNELEFSTFIESVDSYLYQIFFTTLYLTGMRLGECLALTWREIDNDKITIKKNLTRKTDKGPYEIKSPKTISSMRVITISNSLAKILAEYKTSEEAIPGFSENWFVFGRLKPLSQTTIDRVKESAVKKSGVKRIRIHDLRHSFATNMINNGVQPIAVSKMLGHSSVTVTLNIYTHLLEKSSDEMLKQMEQSSQMVLKKFSKNKNIK